MSNPRNGTTSIDRLLGAVPPQDLEAERSVLGSCLLQSEVIDDVLTLISETSFYGDAHRRIFRAMVAMYEAGIHGIDAVTLSHELQRRGELEEIGGPAYIAQLLETVPHAAHAEYYARIVRLHADLRCAIDVAAEIVRSIDGGAEPEEVIVAAEEKLFRILEARQQGDVVQLGDTLEEFLNELDDETPPGIPTGFVDVDRLLGGLRGGRQYVIAARPSMGKTALGLNMASQLARSGRPVVIFSLEQSRHELRERFVASASGVNLSDIAQKRVTDQQRSQLVDACNELHGLPISIKDIAGQTASSISATLRPLVRRGQAPIAIIDYLQLLQAEDSRAPREQQVASMSRRLKLAARELGIPIIVMAQLNRALEARDNKRPRLADLRESGSIEQDADAVMFLYREHVYDSSADPNEAELSVGKNRQGPIGTVYLHWQPEIVTFRSAAARHHAEGLR